MKQNFYKSLALSLLLLISQANIAEASRNYELRAFYGDKAENNVVVIDVKRMQLVAKVPTEGSMPYPVDRAGHLDKVYAITRESMSMDIIDAETLDNLGLLRLNHKPRSGESYNSRLGLALIAGADKPLTSVIDVMNDRVVAEAGDNILTTQTRDNGGPISSGHPAWLTKDRFVVIDRANRRIQLWGIEKLQDEHSLDYQWRTFFLDYVDTPTSVHHILKRDTSMLRRSEKRFFYALAEGKSSSNDRGSIPPAILELRLRENDQLSLIGQVELPGDATKMSSHHADFHPNGQHIYVGSTEGHLFVIDHLSKEVISTIETGNGTGHTRFIPTRNIAIITNHHDTFVTVINTENHTKIVTTQHT